MQVYQEVESIIVNGAPPRISALTVVLALSKGDAAPGSRRFLPTAVGRVGLDLGGGETRCFREVSLPSCNE